MANSTFNGPVRSENGFQSIAKSSTTGAVTSTMTLRTYEATMTVANGATTGKESAVGIPSNFIPMAVMIAVAVELADAVVSTAGTQQTAAADVAVELDNTFAVPLFVVAKLV